MAPAPACLLHTEVLGRYFYSTIRGTIRCVRSVMDTIMYSSYYDRHVVEILDFGVLERSHPFLREA